MDGIDFVALAKGIDRKKRVKLEHPKTPKTPKTHKTPKTPEIPKTPKTSTSITTPWASNDEHDHDHGML